MSDLSPRTTRPVPSDDRLDSWKEIAAYLKRDVTTVQRWEKREAMPVHRHVHDKKGSVYAFRTELDAWARSRNLPLTNEDTTTEPAARPARDIDAGVLHRCPVPPKSTRQRSSLTVALVIDGGRTSCWRWLRAWSLFGGTRVFLAQPARRTHTFRADRLRGHRAGRRTLPRRQIRGVPVGSRRTRWTSGSRRSVPGSSTT